MGKRTEFNLRTVPMLFGVIDEKVTRGDDIVIKKDIIIVTPTYDDHDSRLS